MKITLCIDKQDRNNPSSELRQYLIDIGCPLRSYGEFFDELKISTDDTNNLVGVIIRRCYVDKYGVLKKLEAEEIQELEIPEIMLFEGTNYVYIKQFTNLNMKIEYLTNAEMNKYFASKVEMNSTIKQTYDSIMFAVSTKADKTELQTAISLLTEEIELRVVKDKIISAINMSPETITILANKLGLTANDVLDIIAGNAINMTTKNLSLIADNFSVDKTGYAIMQAGKIANFILADGKLSSEIKVKCDYTEDDLQRMADYIMGRISLTPEEINKYDANKDGILDVIDFVIIRQQIDSGITINNPGKFEIDTTPDDLNVMNLYDGSGNLKYYIGYWVNKLKHLTTESIETESISAGNIDCGNGYCSSNGYTTIEFNKEFYTEPYITATPITTESGLIALKIANITSTSFDITIGGTSYSDKNIEFNWVAILP